MAENLALVDAILSGLGKHRRAWMSEEMVAHLVVRQRGPETI